MPQCKLATDCRTHTQIWSGINVSLLDVHQYLTIFFGTVAISSIQHCLHNPAHEQPSQLSVKTKLSATDLSSVLYTWGCFFLFFFQIMTTSHYHKKDIDSGFSSYQDSHPHPAGYGWAYFACSTQDFSGRKITCCCSKSPN